MKYAFAALLPATLLAACGGGVELKNATADDVAKAIKDEHFIKAGQWNSTVEMTDVTLEGVPEKDKPMAEAMAKAMKGRKQTFDNCVTEEQAKKPAGNMFAGGGAEDCTYESFSMSGGKLDSVMICKGKGGPGPGSMRIAVKGDYSDEAYTMDVDMKMTDTGGPAGSAMSIKARNVSKRTGECKKG